MPTYTCNSIAYIYIYIICMYLYIVKYHTTPCVAWCVLYMCIIESVHIARSQVEMFQCDTWSHKPSDVLYKRTEQHKEWGFPTPPVEAILIQLKGLRVYHLRTAGETSQTCYLLLYLILFLLNIITSYTKWCMLISNTPLRHFISDSCVTGLYP